MSEHIYIYLDVSVCSTLYHANTPTNYQLSYVEVPKESKPWLNSDTIEFIAFFKISCTFSIFIVLALGWYQEAPEHRKHSETIIQSTKHFDVSQWASVPDTAQGVSNPITRVQAVLTAVILSWKDRYYTRSPVHTWRRGVSSQEQWFIVCDVS